MVKRLAVIACLSVALLGTACMRGAPQPNGPEPVTPPTTTPEQPPATPLNPTEAKIGQAATVVVAALRDKDLAALATVVHPERGVRFSPYGHVRTDEEGAHQVFSAAELQQPGLLEQSYLWGMYDGSGEDIVLTFAEFIDRFAYNYDYAAAPQVGWNSVLQTGNTLLNHEDVYPDSLFVEYHVPGSAEYDGMDWGTLRLVFMEHEGTWYVVGIIHDQWTI